MPGPELSYTHGHADAVLRSHRWRTATNSAAYLLGRLAPGHCLLDVGCGPGTLTIELARRVSPGHIIGIDIEPTVLDEARRVASQAGVTNVEFHEGNAYNLSYAEGSFDIVHAHQLLQHLEHPSRAIGEMARVCKTGGVVAARDSDYATFTWFPTDPLLDRWLELYCSVARSNGAEPDAGRRLRAWAREAGLSNVASTASAWCYSTDEDRAWWAGLWAERTTGTRLGEQVVALGLAGTDELAEIAEAWHRWAAQRDGWFAVVHGEITCDIGAVGS
ncbi:MAG: methyltransferase domain-containing protein [Acidimicrobiales bacterium]